MIAASPPACAARMSSAVRTSRAGGSLCSIASSAQANFRAVSAKNWVVPATVQLTAVVPPAAITSGRTSPGLVRVGKRLTPPSMFTINACAWSAAACSSTAAVLAIVLLVVRDECQTTLSFPAPCA